MRKHILLLISIVFLMVACGTSQEDVDAQIATGMAQTLTASPTDTPLPVPTDTPTPTFTPTSTPSPTPDFRVYTEYPEDYLVRKDDLPDSYYHPGGAGWENPTTNSEIIAVRGVEEGKQYIKSTGRIEGYFMCLKRSSISIIAPDELCQWIIIYETAEGASLAQSPEFNSDRTNPEAIQLTNFERVGDESYAYYYEERVSGGNSTVDYILEFRVRNVLVVIGGYGTSEDTDIDYIVSIGKLVLENIEDSMLSDQ